MTRLAAPCALALLLALWPGSARPAPIVIDYQITGGTSTGSLFGGESVASGTLRLTIPNPPNPPIPTTSFRGVNQFTVDLHLVGTAGRTLFRHMTARFGQYGSLTYMPYLNWYIGQYSREYQYYGRYRRVLGFQNRQGRTPYEFQGRFATYNYSAGGSLTKSGAVNFVGHEVLVPEPAAGAMLLPAAGAVLLGGALAARQRLRARRS